MSYRKSCNSLESAKIVNRERDDQARSIKEAIYIRRVYNFNRDEGRYHLSYLYGDILGVAMRTWRGRGKKSLQLKSQFTINLQLIHLLQYCDTTSFLKKSTERKTKIWVSEQFVSGFY